MGASGGHQARDIPGPTGPGHPLDPQARTTMESSFGRSLAGLRIHTDGAAARSASAMGTSAYTVGHDIFFGAGRYRPLDPDGRRLLSHEITHVLQQSGSASDGVVAGPGKRHSTRARAEREATAVASTVASGGRAPPTVMATPRDVARQEPTLEDFDPLEETTDSTATVGVPALHLGEDEDDASLAPPPFGRTVWKKDPSVVFVPITASRTEIATELRVSPSDFVLVGALEAAPPSVEVRGIRFADPSAIPEPLLTEMRQRLDAMLPADVESTVSALTAQSGGWSATRYVLRWSRYAGYRDAGGRSYFDQFLTRLEDRTIVTTRDYLVTETKTVRSGLEELLHQTTGDAHAAVRRARSLSGRAQPGDTAYSVEWRLPPGHVVGRWISGRDGATMAVEVMTVLVTDLPDRDEAEIRLRNAPFIGPKGLIQDSTGRWCGYGFRFGPSLGDVLPPVVGGRDEDGEFTWYYPSTMLVGHGEIDATGGGGNPQVTQGLNTQVLRDAIASGSNRALVSLDLGPLLQATLEQRITIFHRIVSPGFDRSDQLGYSVDLAAQALTRTLMTLPPEEFQAFERRLDETGITARLLATKDSRLAPLGAAFTYQVMAGTNLASEAFTDPTEMVQGTTDISSGLNYYLAEVQRPTAPGGGTTVTFEHGFSTTAWGDTPAWSTRSRTTTGIKRPTDLVSIETVGPGGRQRRIASVFEAALTQGDPESQVGTETMMSFFSFLLLLQGGAGLLRLGATGLRAMAAGNLRAAMQVLATELTSQAGRRAVRSVADFALFSAARYVAAHQSELEKTPEGRAFMAAVTAATALLAIRDVGALVESGAIGRLLLTGQNALKVLGGSARASVTRTMQNFRAAQMAWDVLKAEGKVLVTNVGGVTVRRPVSAEALGNAYRVSQAQLAGQELMTTLGTGAAATRAHSTLGRLERAAGGFTRKAGAAPLTEAEVGAAKAYRDAARHLTAIPAAQRQALLDAMDGLFATKGRSIAELAPFVQAAVGRAGAGNPVAYLEAAAWLAKESGLSRVGLARMAGNAVGKSPANLVWLRTTNLSADDLDFLARDPHTGWKAFSSAAMAPGDVQKLKIAQRGLRGHAAEIVARDEASRLVPGYRVQARQVSAGTSEIDFQLVSTDGLGRRRPMEVKGWTQPTWRRSLEAYRRDPTGLTLLDPMEKAGSNQVRKMLKQLDDAAAITSRGELPVLAATREMSAVDRAALEALVVGKAEVVYLPEAAITATSGRLRTGLKIQ